MASPPIRDSGIALPISQAGTSNFWGYTQDLLQNFIKQVESEDGFDKLTQHPEERILLSFLL